MRKSRVLEKLKNNKPVYVLSSGFLDSVRAAQMAGSIGFDCLWIDMEHRPIDSSEVCNIIAGAYIAGTDTMVRVRKDSYACYFRPLEDGANGLMIPHCNNADEARFVVLNAKYPPLGMRGIDGVGLDTNYGLDLDKEYGTGINVDYKAFCNDNTFILIQIEDLAALDNLDEMAAIDGIDIIFIGTADMRKGLATVTTDVEDALEDVIKRVAEASKKYGKYWGLPVGSREQADKYISMGAKFITVGSDRGALMYGLKAIYSKYNTL